VRRSIVAAVLILAPWALAAQYRIDRLAGARFVERVQSEIITQAGAAERHRTVVRTAGYQFVARADSLLVTTDTVALSESVNGIRTPVDVDAVIGARWKLLLDSRGTPVVLDRPFVPVSIADVSDVGTAMDDFFPPPPPRLATGATGTDSAGRRWGRIADSAGIERYHFSGTHRGTTRDVGDSLTVESTQDATETTDLAWDRARGPVAWLRSILTTVTTRFAGRTVRAQVDQRIKVSREP
jgi:hypothetical protein